MFGVCSLFGWFGSVFSAFELVRFVAELQGFSAFERHSETHGALVFWLWIFWKPALLWGVFWIFSTSPCFRSAYRGMPDRFAVNFTRAVHVCWTLCC